MGGNGGFLTPKPSFPDFGVFDPCKGRTDSQGKSQKLFQELVFPLSDWSLNDTCLAGGVATKVQRRWACKAVLHATRIANGFPKARVAAILVV